MIEFRFSGGRWEPVPAGYSIIEAKLLYANYELRIDGIVYPPTSEEPTRRKS
jgi:hypothetical protein